MLIDTIFFVLVVVCAAVGFINGGFRTFVAFFGWVASILISYFLAKAIADAFLSEKVAAWIVQQSGIFDRIYGFLPDTLKEISMQSLREMHDNGYTAEQIVAGITDQSQGLLFLVASIVKSAVARPIYLDSAITNVALAIALELTYHIYVIIVGLLLFLVLRIIIMGVTLIFKAKSSEKVTAVGRIVGIAVGAVRGFAYGCIVLALMGYFSGIVPSIQEQVDSSLLAPPVNSWIEQASEKITEDKELEQNESYKNMISALEQRLAQEDAEQEQA